MAVASDLSSPASDPPSSSLTLFQKCLLLLAEPASTSTNIPPIIAVSGSENPKLDARNLWEVFPLLANDTVAAVAVVSPTTFVGFVQPVFPPSLKLAPVPAKRGPAVAIYTIPVILHLPVVVEYTKPTSSLVAPVMEVGNATELASN